MARVAQASLSISLPRSLRRVVQQRVRAGGFGNVSEYIRALVRADQQQAQGASRPLPGVAAQGGESGSADAVHERTAAASGPVLVDFSAEEWRELRQALLAGEVQLMQYRLGETAGLFRTMLSMRREALRRERPRAKAGQIEAALASWLREQCAEPEDEALRSAPERLARFQHG